MKLNWMVSFVAVMGFATVIFSATAQSSNIVATASVYVPDTSHANDPLPGDVLAWDNLSKETNATADQNFARFTFAFTNLAKKIDIGLSTNVINFTNLTTITNSSFWARLRGNHIHQVATISRSTNTISVTNFTPVSVTILDVHPSCGCTTAQLPPLPWVVPAGTNEQFGVTVNLAGKSGTIWKTVKVTTDMGYTQLSLKINIHPPVTPTLSEADRARGMEMAKVDRQAVFKNDCITCHVKPGTGKYGKALYDAVCGICHEAEHRATMVPDLHAIKTPTNAEFWQTWIAHGKPGSLMPAFATADGGPLTDIQIASLAAYLNAAIPSHAVPPPQ